jgi:hypothetical protein
MCFSSPEPPKLRPLPTPPSASMDEVREREARTRAAIAMSGQGTSGTVKTDLAPSQLMGQRKVLLGV